MTEVIEEKLQSTFDIDDVCPTTTASALRRAVLLAPQNECIAVEGVRRTFADLASDVDRTRSALAAHGVNVGDRVGIWVSNSYEWVVQFLAITTRGAIAVPVNTRFRSRDLEYCINHSRMSFLFLEARVLTNDLLTTLQQILPDLEASLPGAALPELRTVVVLGADSVPAGAISWNEFLGSGTHETTATCSPEDPALIQYTSGTTSHPKGVLLTHRAICGNGFASGVRLGLRPGDRMHSARPFFHVAGTTQSILACLQHGTTLISMARFTAKEALQLMSQERCTHFSGNDTMAIMLLEEYRQHPVDLALRGAWLAASPPTVSAVIDELGCSEAVVAYGLSEAAPNVALSAWWEPEKIRKTATALPQIGVEVNIRGIDGASVPDGMPGEIIVRGWNVMLGYWNDKPATDFVLDHNGWLSTGDLGAIQNGRLAFLGRLKEIIRVGGENVAPGEVEDVIKSHPGVSQVCVVGVPDPRLVEVVCAVIEPTNVDRSTIEADVVAWCKAQIAGFKVPRHVVVVDSIELLGMTESSKIRRKDARAYALRQLRIEDS